jgi:hypothetical protein
MQRNTEKSLYSVNKRCSQTTTILNCLHKLSFLQPGNKKRLKNSWGEVRLSPLGTSATIWPTVPAPNDRLCGLVVRVLGYRSGGPGSILGTTRQKKKIVGLERGPLSLVSTTEELLDRKVEAPV